MHVEPVPQHKHGKRRSSEPGSLSMMAKGWSRPRGRRRFYQKPAGRSGPVVLLQKGFRRDVPWYHPRSEWRVETG
jgi:hypothetical protein